MRRNKRKKCNRRTKNKTVLTIYLKKEMLFVTYISMVNLKRLSYSKFIPMKTPLSPTLLADPAAFENVLTLPAFLEAQLKLGRKVGLIIDLSNHDCLYHDGVPADVRRVHVRNVAKSVPDVAVVSEAVAVSSACLPASAACSEAPLPHMPVALRSGTS